MRTTTLPCMMETLSRNNAYRNKAAKLYEMAKVYLPVEGEDLPKEDVILTLGHLWRQRNILHHEGRD